MEKILGKKIFDHFLVPKHTILSEGEVNELLKRYNITKDKLPKILVSDPVVKILGAKIGDVLKIERDSFTAGKYYYYRIVVSSLDKEISSDEIKESSEDTK